MALKFLNDGFFDGKVGIGETAPTEKFVVNGSVNSINQSVNFATGPYRAVMDIQSTGKLVRIGSVKGAVTPTGDEGEVALYVNNLEKVRIDKDGQVGIGTTNPTSELHVEGADNANLLITRLGVNKVLLGDSGSNNGGDLLLYNSTGVLKTSIRSDANSYLIGGNVGIGTTSPPQKLTVNGGALITSNLISPGNIGTYTYNAAAIDYRNNGTRLWSWGNATTRGSFSFIQLESDGQNQQTALTINSAGNVGIGTDSPTAKLDITETTAETNTLKDVLRLNHLTSGTPVSGLGAGILFSAQRPINSANLSRGAIYGVSGPNENDDGDLAFHTRTDTAPDSATAGMNEKMRITHDGNVGIGTTSPVARLEIFGAGQSPNSQSDVMAVIRNTTYGSTEISGENKLLFGWNNHYAAAISAYKDGTINRTGFKFYTEVGFNVPVEAMRITSAGNVGIGTTNPLVKLHLESDGSTSFRIQRADGAATSGYLAIASEASHNTIYSRNTDGNTAKKIRIVQGSTETLSILANGNVGIGTDSPISPLQVIGGTSYQNISIGSSLNDNTIKRAGITFPHYDAQEEQVALINSYIDTNISYVSIGGSSNDFNATENIRFYTAADTSTLTGTERMRIDDTGNVGIGETNPSYKLDVDGSGARIGSSNQTTTSLYLTATNTDGAPAVATQIIMQGYEGRAKGTFYTDVSETGEWFNGVPYNASHNSWHVGFDETGGEAEYRANSILTVRDNGNVGIGEGDPGEKLVVNGSVNSINQSASFATGPYRATMDIISDSKLVRIGSVKGAVTPTGDEGEVAFFVNNFEKARIDKDGNFGVGVTNPGATLDVSGSFRLQSGGSTYLSIGSSSGSPYINTGTSGGTVQFGAPASNTTNIQVQGTVRATGGYKSADGTAGITGTFTFVDKASATRSLTIKNGLITAKT